MTESEELVEIVTNATSPFPSDAQEAAREILAAGYSKGGSGVWVTERVYDDGCLELVALHATVEGAKTALTGIPEMVSASLHDHRGVWYVTRVKNPVGVDVTEHFEISEMEVGE